MESYESRAGSGHEAARARVHQFFEMDREEEGRLKERIASFEGAVRIFVHPEFEEYSKADAIKDNPNNVATLLRWEKAYQKILTSKDGHLPPLFVFEGGRSFEQFSEKEDTLGGLVQNDTYVIRTRPSNPTPLYPDESRKIHLSLGLFPDSKEKEEGEQMWEWLVAEFERFGIEKALVGGLELYVNPKEEEDGSTVTLRGCVGMVISKLQDTVDIELSNFTWPDRKTDIA